MAGGYIKLWRKIKDWEWFNDPPVLCFFIYCLTTAAYKPTTYHGSDIDTGCFVASIRTMSAATGLSEKQVRRSIECLISSGEIEIINRARSGHHIKVSNYAEYQAVEETDRARSGKAKGNPKGKGSILLNRKKEKKKEYIPPISPKGDGEREEEKDEYRYPGITYLG